MIVDTGKRRKKKIIHYSQWELMRLILFTHPLEQTLSNSKDVDPKHLNHPVNINIFVILSLTLALRARGAQELRSQC